MAVFMKLNFLIAFSILCLASVYGKEFQPAYFYSPEEVSLTGTVQIKTFPGPNTYERALVLILDRPIIAIARKEKDDFPNDSEENVRYVHLIYSKNWKGFHKKRTRVRGSLLSKHTGHHYGDVLMDVKSIEVLR